MACEKRKLNVLSIGDKIKMLRFLDENKLKKKGEIAAHFKIPFSTLSTIIKNRETIEKYYESGNKKRMKIRNSSYPEVEECVRKWLVECRDQNLHVSGLMLQKKAENFAKELDPNTEFKASNGWLENFKNRQSILFQKVSCESDSADVFAKELDLVKSKEASGSSKEETDHIPLEPTVEIKIEPTDYEPTPSTSKDTANEEFILPHEDHSWTTPTSVVEPQLTLSVSDMGSLNKPEITDNEQPKKKRKTESTVTPYVPSTNGPTTSPQSSVYNFSEFPSPGSSKEHHKDHFDVFGEYIAAKLRNLDRISCAFAQKAIGDIIFEAEMGKYLNQPQNTTH